jgi:hypothetical protein
MALRTSNRSAVKLTKFQLSLFSLVKRYRYDMVSTAAKPATMVFKMIFCGLLAVADINSFGFGVFLDTTQKRH